MNEYGCSTVVIRMNTPTGKVAMESCSACDQRWWHVDGEEVDRAEAFDGLAKAQSPTTERGGPGPRRSATDARLIS